MRKLLLLCTVLLLSPLPAFAACQCACIGGMIRPICANSWENPAGHFCPTISCPTHSGQRPFDPPATRRAPDTRPLPKNGVPLVPGPSLEIPEVPLSSTKPCDN